MSKSENDLFLEEVGFYIDYWEGTLYADEMRWLLDNGDWEQLKVVLEKARYDAWKKEYQPTEDIRTF